MKLTGLEIDFIHYCARFEDTEQRKQAWIDRTMPGWETPNGVKLRINRLLQRPDARLELEAERRRASEQRTKAMQEADSAGWERSEALAKLDKTMINTLTEAFSIRIQALRDEGKSAQDIAKLAEVSFKILGRGEQAPALTDEQRKRLMEQANLAEKADNPPKGEEPAPPTPPTNSAMVIGAVLSGQDVA